jgi:hypothetical protein
LLYFLNPVRNEPGVFVLYAVATASLVAAARAAVQTTRQLAHDRGCEDRTDACAAGRLHDHLLYVSVLAPLHVPFALYLVVSAGVVGFLAHALIRARWRPLPDWLLFGLGDYLTFCIFSALVCVVTDRNPVQAIAGMTILLAGIIYLILSVTRRPFGRTAQGEPARGAV